MSEYDIVQNHLVFKELGSDSVGANFRAGEIKDKKAVKHRVLSKVHPFLSGKPKVWQGLKALMKGVRSSKIANLYCPEELIEDDQKAFLIYPLLKCGTLEDILDDSIRKDVPIDLDISFSIAITIADILEQCSSITINKKKSYHGLLTPDNILIDMDGKILLKNYGLFPYLGKIPELSNRLVKKYRSLLPPEWFHRQQLTPQTDIYILGNILYRLMTGEYFAYSPGDDFESKLSTIEFTLNIDPPEEGNFQENIIALLKKALNPDPAKRFVSIKEFSEYLNNSFQINDVSSSTFVNAYFMNLLYMKTIEAEDNRLKEELSYEIPEKKEVTEEQEINADYLRQEITARLEERRRSKPKFLIPLIAVIIIAAGIIGFLIVNQQEQAEEHRKAQEQRAEDLERNINKTMEGIKAEYAKRLKAIEEKSALTIEEKKAQDIELAKLKKWREMQEMKSRELIAKMRVIPGKKPIPVVSEQISETKTPGIKKPEKKASPVKEKIEKKETGKTDILKVKKTIPGSLVPLNSVTYTPNKLRGKSKLKADDLALPYAVRRKYKGQQVTLQPKLLINTEGNVTDVEFQKDLPPEMASKITANLKGWKFFPAEVDKIKVKVWYPVNLTVSFGGGGIQVMSKDEITPLDSVTFRPSRLSGKSRFKAKDLKLSRSIRKNYKGQTLILRPEILINKIGNVKNVKFESVTPVEIKTKVTEILLKWKYVPAEKNKVKVNIWYPAKVRIAFK